ncbi:hypothetical protein K0M31_008105 [Melipona bicolor]|uniref:Uncharacterized protein n=1 Tax=Melipona bicolor TaxID=60889 RepID=A0AA40FQZ7_9HYME|nr:hypothetical protein K0M31_008105 [Melipona bicolor]
MLFMAGWWNPNLESQFFRNCTNVVRGEWMMHACCVQPVCGGCTFGKSCIYVATSHSGAHIPRDQDRFAGVDPLTLVHTDEPSYVEYTLHVPLFIATLGNVNN